MAILGLSHSAGSLGKFPLPLPRTLDRKGGIAGLVPTDGRPLGESAAVGIEAGASGVKLTLGTADRPPFDPLLWVQDKKVILDTQAIVVGHQGGAEHVRPSG